MRLYALRRLLARQSMRSNQAIRLCLEMSGDFRNGFDPTVIELRRQKIIVRLTLLR
jgi:hypothetical protein